MDYLDDLEARSLYIIREAVNRVDPLGMLWSIGKDSTVLLWLLRKALYGRAPIPMIQLDTAMELDEVYAFRDQLTKDWNLDLHVEMCPPEEDMDQTLPPATRAATRKTEGLRNMLQEKQLKGLFVGIRRDEQAMRAKERVFSLRDEHGNWPYKDQPAEMWDHYVTDCPQGWHIRIHPLLHWTELDIWRYIRQENIPCVPLYFAQNGKRYRSLGEKNITSPIDSDAATIDEIIAELEQTKEAEREGRSMDRETEDSFERLRAGGYM